MSDNQAKFQGNDSQKPEAREPDAILPADYQDFEDEEEGEDEYYEEDEEYEDDEYEDEDEDESNQYSTDPYALAQQLASSPLFAQVQAMLGGANSAQARLNSAKIKQATGDLEGAAEIYLDIIEEDPDNYQAHVSLGQILMMMDRPAEAETFLLKATELQPEEADGYLYLGYAHYAQQKYEECIQDFGEAVQYNPDSHLAWNNLGFAQYLAGHLEDAEKTFVKAGDVGSNRAYYNLGLVRLIQGKDDKAWEAYEEAEELDPHGSQIEDHLQDLEQAKTLHPDRITLLDEAIERLNSQFEEEDEDDEEYEDEEEDEYSPKD